MKFEIYRVLAIFVALFGAASMATSQGLEGRTSTTPPSSISKSLDTTKSLNPKVSGAGSVSKSYTNEESDNLDSYAESEEQTMETERDSYSEKNKSNTNRTNSDKNVDVEMNTQDSGMGSVGLLLLLVLAICGLFVYKHRKGFKKFIGSIQSTKKTVQPTPPVSSRRTDDLTDLQKKFDYLQTQIEGLNSELQKEKREIQRLNEELGRLTQKPSPVPLPPKPPHPQTTVLYAQSVVPNAFLESGIKNDLNDYTIAIIQLKNQNEGEYRINEKSSVQPMLINNFAFGVKLVSTVRNKNLTPTRIDTIQNGIIRKQGDRWVVGTPALIDVL